MRNVICESQDIGTFCLKRKYVLVLFLLQQAKNKMKEKKKFKCCKTKFKRIKKIHL